MTINDSGAVEQYAAFFEHILVYLLRFDELLDLSSSRLVEVVEGLLDVPVPDPEAAEEPAVFLGAWAFRLAMGPLSQGADSFVLPVIAAMGCSLHGKCSILNRNRCDRVYYHRVHGLA